jgi:hypothetical protein
MRSHRRSRHRPVIPCGGRVLAGATIFFEFDYDFHFSTFLDTRTATPDSHACDVYRRAGLRRRN